MARITEEASATVSMNMEPARKALNEATAAARQFKRELEELEAIPDGKKSLDEKLRIEELKDLLTLSTKEIDKAKAKLETFQNTMKNLKTSSFNDLYKASKELESQIRKLKPGTEEYIAASHDLKQVRTRLNDLKEGWKAVSVEAEKNNKSIRRIAEGFNMYWSMFDTLTRTITGVSAKFRQCAEDAAKLDDVYADVMKTTGLLHDEVEGLDQELMKIDTRTSREQLLLLARDAGKLGISGREDIMGFVRAADQIQVALGEDLGEGAIRNLGKIADVFGLTKEMGIEKSLLSIASAVNALGQASTASEAYLVDFTQRLAGVGAMAGLSVQDILGFASGLDQSAMKVEMAATAFQKFLMKMYEDTATFAGYAGMKVEEFSELLKTDANTAITTVMKAMNGQDGFASLVPMFDKMGLDGARAVTVLASMTQNLEAVTEAQALANEEFTKATSVSEEYQTKNNNLQAQLEKARKEFHNASVALGQSLNPVMLKSTKAITYIIKALATYGKEIKAAVIAVAALTLVVKANAIAEGIRNAALKIGNALNKTGVVTSNYLKLGYYRLTGQTMKAAAAQTALNTAMSASVFGVIAIAVGLLVGALVNLVRRNREAAQSTDELTEKENWELEVSKKIASAKSEQAGKIVALTKIVHDENIAYGERLKALNELKKIVPDYHASLTTEGKLINDNITAVENYVEALKREAVVKKLGDEFGEIEARKIELESMLADLNESIAGKDLVDEGEWKVDKEVAKTTIEIMKLEKELDEVSKKSEKLQGMIEKAVSTNLGSGSGTGGGGGGGDGDKKGFEAQLKQIEENQRREEIALKQSLMNREITQTEYNAQMNLLVMRGLQQRIELAKKYGQDETKYVSQLLDEEIKLVGDGMEDLREMTGKAAMPDIVDQKAYTQFWDAIYKKRDEIVASLQDKSLKDEYDNEMMWLNKLHQEKLLSEEEFENAKLNLKKRFAEDYIQQFNAISEKASNFVKAIQDAELANAEANYQAQLTAAGDNAEQREAVEAAYEQRKLDIQKKYADADMVINIAKTIGAGALAVMQAFAQLGPVAGAVAAALIGVTTVAEVATIIAQRNAIKNTSVSSSGSVSAPKTGQRKMTGYAEGGYTEGHTTLTTVGEKGVEYVIPHWMVQRNPVMVANLERYRKAGSHGRSGTVQHGFADGGYTTPSQSQPAGVAPVSQDVDWQAMREFNAVMRYCAEHGLFVKYGDILIAKDKMNNFKNQTTR